MKKIAVVSLVVGGLALLVGLSIAGQEITINKQAGGEQKSVTIQSNASGVEADQSVAVESSSSTGLLTTVSVESLEEDQKQQAALMTASPSLEPQQSVVVENTGDSTAASAVTAQRILDPLGVQKTVSIGGPGGIVVEKNVSGTGTQKSVTIGQGAIVVDKNVAPAQQSVVVTGSSIEAAVRAADAAGDAADAAGRAADAAGRAADAAGAEADRIADIIDSKH